MATLPPNYQPPPEGYGSYLKGILPDELAIAAGSFSAAIQQVINVKDADFEKFSQVAASIEVTTANLPLINGTDVPVDLQKTEQNTVINAMGSGPHGTYVMSDFFGCMSGLPYSWRELRSTILQAQTTKLTNIYQELFLAVTWEGAEVDVILETRQVLISPGPPPEYQTEYRCAGFSVVNKGGGYGRGTAPNPIITASNGGSGLGIVGRSPPGAQSLGGGSYGRINSCSLTSPGSWVLSPPTVTSIQYPPTATLPVLSSGNKSTGGSNTAYGTVGWPSPMNTVVQQYIDQANTEIRFIASSKRTIVKRLNAIYDYNGKQLEIEQRCRYLALAPVPIPRDRFISTYPTTISSFVDAISTYAQSTRPHMYAQTLEAISDLKSICGQSAVGLMRQERNVERLQKINVSVENNVPGKIETELEKPLIANGTLPVGRKGSGIEVRNVNGNNNDPITTYTVPSTLIQQLDEPVTVGKPTGSGRRNKTLAPKPKGYFNPNKKKFVRTRKTKPISGPIITPTGNEQIISASNGVQNILAIENVAPLRNINLLGPSGDGTGPAKPLVTVSNFDPGSLQGGVVNLSPAGSNIQIPLELQIPDELTTLINQPLGGLEDIISLNLSGEGDVTSVILRQNQGLTPEDEELGEFSESSLGTGIPTIDPNTELNSNALNMIPIEPIAVVVVGAATPTGEGEILDDGSATYPGSLAGSPDINFIPPNLDLTLTSSVLLPSTLSVNEAIDDVIKCNCDCWID